MQMNSLLYFTGEIRDDIVQKVKGPTPVVYGSVNWYRWGAMQLDAECKTTPMADAVRQLLKGRYEVRCRFRWSLNETPSLS